MSNPARCMDAAFQGAGQRVGTEIWRIENFQPVPLPKTDYGKFYAGDSYIVVQTSMGKGGVYLHDIHFWIGKDTSQDESRSAASKAVELDAALGGRAVLHREPQGFESDKFLSYFKPCIMPLEGGIISGFKKLEDNKFETRLYVCKGKRIVRLKQVPFLRSSLNHDDVFILDTEKKIYQFNGANSNIQERAKALEVIQHLKDVNHDRKCDVAIVDDGKLVAESDSGDFWVLFGGFAPIGRKIINEDDIPLETIPGKLYCISDGLSKFEESALSKSMLENNKSYLLDCGAEVFVWVGRVTQVEDRKAAIQAAEDHINSQSRPKSTRITRVIQGYETQSFKSNFESWPVGTGTPAAEEGRGKVAALLKQQGVDVKGAAKSAPVNDEIPPLLPVGGKIEIWRINGSAKTPLPKEEIGKFFSGDCYIILYTCNSGDKKDEYFLSVWMGKHSTKDDRVMASRLANTMCNSLKGRPVQGRIIEEKEPPQFIAIFQPMVVLKGGMCSGYKKLIADKNLTDDTYTSESIALIQVSNTSLHNHKVVQVDALATCLCSSDCFLLQSGSSLFVWHGNSSTFEQQEWATKIADFLKPGVAFKTVKEGTETSAFWFALGGKQSYSSKKVAQETVKDPHLYTFSLRNGNLQISEVYNFSQDDLLPEDILILDTHAEVFLWVGQSVDHKERQNVFDIGLKYIELAKDLDGLSPDVPLYKITEGNEPCFFTVYFSWDSAKAVVPGNSFTKKFSLLFGASIQGSESPGKSDESNRSGPTQRASALAALSSAFNPTSTRSESSEKSQDPNNSGPTQRASAWAALSSAFNPTSAQHVSSERSHQPNHTGPTQRASALASLSSAFNPTPAQPSVPKPVRSAEGSQRAAAVAALSGVLTAEAPARFSRSPPPVSGMTITEDPSVLEPNETASEKETLDVESISETSDATPELNHEDLQTDENDSACTFSYERLKATSTNPVKGIDYKRREAYLSETEFQSVFGIPKVKFYSQPKWKQDIQKRKLDLF